MQYKHTIVPVAFSLLLASCFKEDERVDPFPGSIITINDSVQKYQSYFDLETGQVVRAHNNNQWEIGFESSEEGWHIITNSGNSWFLYNTNQKSFNHLPDVPSGLYGLYDIQSAWPDSTAAGDWVTFHNGSKDYSQNIYILTKLTNGSFTSKIMLQFLTVSDTAYSFIYQDPHGNADTVSIKKDTTVNFVYYSFTDRRQKNLEPQKSAYDIVFTSYYNLATNFNITMPYLVGGGILNGWNTMGALDSIHPYAEIDWETISRVSLTNNRNIPGYNWKTVTVDVSGGGAATYEVKTHYTYLFKTAAGNYYKLRFLSYSLDGRSGHPQFEYQLLE